jgi:hypothetical protein
MSWPSERWHQVARDIHPPTLSCALVESRRMLVVAQEGRDEGGFLAAASGQMATRSCGRERVAERLQSVSLRSGFRSD